MPSAYICCPAYAIDGPLRRARILESIAHVTRRLEYTLVPSPLMDRHMGSGAWLPFEERRLDMRRALEHDVVWAAYGGYGSIHLVEDLLAADAPARPRLVGYSDITVLHALWRVRGWGESCYTSHPGALGSRGATSLLALLRGEGYCRDGYADAGVRVLHPGRAQGSCLSACVSVLSGLCGTSAMPSLRGSVLAIEDVEERPFQIDYALMQLHLSRALDGVAAIIGGAFTYKERSDYEGPTCDEVLAAWAKRLNVPCISRMPFGHIEDGLAMPGGRTVELIAKEDGTWTMRVLPAGSPP